MASAIYRAIKEYKLEHQQSKIKSILDQNNKDEKTQIKNNEKENYFFAVCCMLFRACVYELLKYKFQIALLIFAPKAKSHKPPMSKYIAARH